MKHWLSQLNFDPISPLLPSGSEVVEYFVKRDLLEECVEPLGYIWCLPGVQKMLQKQQTDGSWKYPGKPKTIYPKHHYRLLETWKMFRSLVEEYGFTREHPAARKAAEFIFSCQTKDGDIRGFIGNQYATSYTGAVMAILIKAGFENEPRIEKGFRWLFRRQGGI